MIMKGNINTSATEIPMFSIIVPIYNSDKTLYECVNSLFAGK